ncbi:TPA: helix-turn-helix transcriptional regulator [Streptococcus suis]|uniref:Helix-turn-helix domain-containing protein n=1 Tax=Streptococcus suis TaxID=1307 RepID=A0A9X4MM51_STRSU|nr:helix-turn-helix transcriptional regulator [Streptococcus suis]HEQ8383868.1 helix-turn-helix transcriptional regulator [Streptococcus pyogenes]MDG4515377.1 helix-turn-helix domain-containing protein [Streptococcus suis]QTA57554.1 helix-turn-helix transcriptional regulator [Streptococcus suis]HEL1929702.1 helix-turn-helix transcriptional regulator [Streptococcus suis]HEM5979251.1 helix-turn-helix transcriptional regulator [Streptococcus suis]
MISAFEKIKYLAKKQGKSLGQVEEDLGYGRNTLYKIKNSSPSTDRMQEIADYFHVSLDYLVGRTNNPNIAQEGQAPATNPLEEQALVMFRKETSGMSEADVIKFTTALKGLMNTARALIEDDSNWE